MWRALFFVVFCVSQASLAIMVEGAYKFDSSKIPNVQNGSFSLLAYSRTKEGLVGVPNPGGAAGGVFIQGENENYNAYYLTSTYAQTSKLRITSTAKTGGTLAYADRAPTLFKVHSNARNGGTAAAQAIDPVLVDPTDPSSFPYDIRIDNVIFDISDMKVGELLVFEIGLASFQQIGDKFIVQDKIMSLKIVAEGKVESKNDLSIDVFAYTQTNPSGAYLSGLPPDFGALENDIRDAFDDTAPGFLTLTNFVIGGLNFHSSGSLLLGEYLAAEAISVPEPSSLLLSFGLVLLLVAIAKGHKKRNLAGADLPHHSIHA